MVVLVLLKFLQVTLPTLPPGSRKGAAMKHKDHRVTGFLIAILDTFCAFGASFAAGSAILT